MSARIVNVWNSLPNAVVDAGTVKSRLDKFWQHQAVKFDSRCDLTGTGNRSELSKSHKVILFAYDSRYDTIRLTMWWERFVKELGLEAGVKERGYGW